MSAFRLSVRAKPGARRDQVGGRWGDDDTLVVAVQARAVDGKANAAIEKVVAAAFAVPRRSVRIVTGDRSRTKIIEIDPDPPKGHERLAELLE